MRKIVNLFYLCLSVLIVSCGDDDDAIGNLPPMEVTNIEAQVTEGTLVRISWNESEDINNDELSYDVVVNGRVAADRTTELSLIYDVSDLIDDNSKKSQKGLSLELTINIKAYDTNGGVSEESEVKRNVFVNRNPGEFEFSTINFDFSNYNWLEVSWYPAIDEDDDILSYDVYLNDLIIKEDYIIGSDDYDGLGSVYYNNNYAQYIDEEIIIKVVANDRDGGITEISKSFDFRGTDIELGMLALPYNNALDYTINEDEVDRKIGYVFEIDENIGYVIRSDEYAQLRLSDDQGNYIAGSSQRISGESLSPGTYYLEVGDYYSNTTLSGTVTFILKDPKESDVNLNTLSIPYEEVINFDIQNNEPDNRIGYTFEITEDTGFSVFSDIDVSFELKDANGYFITSGYRRASLETIQAGTYYLEVYHYYYNNVEPGSFTLVLNDPNETDIDLGVLNTPYSNSMDFTVARNEPDGKIKLLFEINESVGYYFDTQIGAYMNLYDSNNNYINSGYRDIYGENLNPGAYYLEIENQNYNDISGIISMILSNSNESDVDLGVLSTPYDQSFDFNTTNEVDRKIRYQFTVEAQVSYAFQIVNESYDDYIYLYDSNGNYLNGSDYYEINGSLAPGSYYIEVSGYSNQTGFGTLLFNLQ